MTGDTMTTVTTDEYPEHTKLRAIADKSQAIGEFVDWLAERGIHLAEYQRILDCEWVSWETQYGSPKLRCRDGKLIDHLDEPTGRDCERCNGTGKIEAENPRMYPIFGSTTKLLAEFFDIDQNKIEVEKRAMLTGLREETP